MEATIKQTIFAVGVNQEQKKAFRLSTIFRDRWAALEGAIPANSPRAFALATLCIGIATLVRWAMGDAITLLFPTYYPAILLVSLVCGFAVSLYAVALSIVAAVWFFMPPAYELGLSTSQVLNISLFTFAATLIAWIGNSRRKLNDQTRLLTRELQHRGKNQLMVVQAILLQTLRRDADLERALQRIGSLAITDELLSRSRDQAAPLHELAVQQLQPFGERISVQGPPWNLSSDLATVMVLSLQEFATNAAKYGALSSPDGRVILTWDIEKELRITWRESGGPAIADKPGPKGEGLELVRKLVRGVGGSVSSEYATDGITHTISLPIKNPRSAIQLVS
jgi:two-component sensor histidine kinase